MSTAKQRIAIVASAMLLLSGCANQGGGQVRSIPKEEKGVGAYY